MPKQTINLEPQILDLVLYAGDGAEFSLVVIDEESGTAVNLSGGMEAQVRTERGTTDPPEATFSVNLSRAAEGIAVLMLTGAQTEDLAKTEKFTGVWDVEWTPVGKQPLTLCQGGVVCLLDVSR